MADVRKAGGGAWGPACKSCDSPIPLVGGELSKELPDGAVRYKLDCRKCGHVGVYLKPATAEGTAEPMTRAAVLNLAASLLWGALAGFSAWQVVRYERVLGGCVTVYQEISVSLVFLAEVLIPFVACYAAAAVLHLSPLRTGKS